jgi:hypothetical protein
MLKGSLSIAAAAVMAAAGVITAVAQEGGWGSDAEDFSVQRPARMKTEADPDAADFSAALEAAAEAEGRAAASKTVSGDTAAKKEFVPKNEITVIEKPVAADSAAGKKKAKKERSGERLAHNMGARLGVGSEIGLSLGFGIGLSDVNRLGIGINMGWGVVGEDNFSVYEGIGFYDWNFNISDDGALRWFVGPGVTFGYYGTVKDNTDDWIKELLPPKDTALTWTAERLYNEIDKKIKNREKVWAYEYSLGIGARIGLEVDLSFIDPDHALSVLRSSSVSLDVRFITYLFMSDDMEHFPMVTPTLGITYNYVFGGGKEKK